ncbi:MAG: ATP-binding protein [Actinobacteria bacterium]|nr:ATP-binding protein [Actinomycetota bacterium]
MSENPKSILVAGESGSGKSACLRNLRGQEGVLYINAEGGKPLPFKNKFKRVTIDDPLEIFDLYQQVINNPGRFHTIVIDTVSFMMDRFESVHVVNSANTMAAWGNYGQFFKTLMYDYVAKFEGYSVMLGHVDAVLDENTGKFSYTVPVKGALKKNGLEAYFTTVVGAKKATIKEIEKDAKEGNLLKITERDRDIGYKHVFQTRTTRATVGDRLRSPFGLFEDDETFIDNDVQLVIDQLVGYYSE